nr:MAG TPA: hypothetical protein [Caudoviricetes sp.]
MKQCKQKGQISVLSFANNIIFACISIRVCRNRWQNRTSKHPLSATTL